LAENGAARERLAGCDGHVVGHQREIAGDDFLRLEGLSAEVCHLALLWCASLGPGAYARPMSLAAAVSRAIASSSAVACAAFPVPTFGLPCARIAASKPLPLAFALAGAAEALGEAFRIPAAAFGDRPVFRARCLASALRP